MITGNIEERFHITKNLTIEYAISLPFLTGNEERLFSYEWKTIDGDKHLVIHDLYVRDCESGAVVVKEINDDTRISNRLSDGLMGLEALEAEDLYMENHEKAVSGEGKEVIDVLRDCFNKLITDQALRDAYNEFGLEFD